MAAPGIRAARRRRGAVRRRAGRARRDRSRPPARHREASPHREPADRATDSDGDRSEAHWVTDADLPGDPVAHTGTPGTAPAAAGALHLDHACLVADNPPTSAHIPPGDPFGSDLSDLGSGAELQRLYVVHSGTLEPADSAGPVRECDRQLWAIVVAATPLEVLPYVDELLVFDADLNGGTAGGEVSAQPNSTEASAHWRFWLALNASTDLDVAFNVAHEVGHLLSLNRGEMTGQDESSCQGTLIDEGV